jgi:hypothetical protein
MSKRIASFRTLLAGTVFAGAMVFGTMQAIATDASDPGTQYVGCNSWACKKECAPFGGDLGPGGPGKPLKCLCCG